jgi:transcriptional regulator with XRE-family HTH domain
MGRLGAEPIGDEVGKIGYVFAMTQRRSRLAAARHAVGFSQEVLALRLGCANNTMSRWERGRTDPRPGQREALAGLLGVTMEELDWLLVRDCDIEDPAYDDPVNRREALTGLAAVGAAVALPASLRAGLPEGVSGRVGVADVERLRAEAVAVKWAERRYGGGTAYGPTQDLVVHVRQVLSGGNYSPEVDRQLHGLLSQLWRDLGWCAHDAGDQYLARAHYNEALNAATVADDGQMTVVLNYMAQQANECGSGRVGVALAGAAMQKARSFGSDRMFSLLGSQAARGYACEGDSAAAYAAFAEAERRYQPYDPGRDPEWLAFWDPADLRAHLASGHLALGNPRAAESAARAALGELDWSRYPRDIASYSSWRALALGGQGEIDAAAACTVETVGLLEGVQSGRIAGRLRTLVPVFEANPTVPGVGEALVALRSA